MVMEVTTTQPDDRQTLNILQRLHQNILLADQPYVGYAGGCRWQYAGGVYRCEHVAVPLAEVTQMYQLQMKN